MSHRTLGNHVRHFPQILYIYIKKINCLFYILKIICILAILTQVLDYNYQSEHFTQKSRSASHKLQHKQT